MGAADVPCGMNFCCHKQFRSWTWVRDWSWVDFINGRKEYAPSMYQVCVCARFVATVAMVPSQWQCRFRWAVATEGQTATTATHSKSLANSYWSAIMQLPVSLAVRLRSVSPGSAGNVEQCVFIACFGTYSRCFIFPCAKRRQGFYETMTGIINSKWFKSHRD